MKGSVGRPTEPASSPDDSLKELRSELDGFKKATTASFGLFLEDFNCLRRELLTLQSAVQLYHHSLLREPPWPPEVVRNEQARNLRRLHRKKVAKLRKARREKKRSKWQEVRRELLSVTGVSVASRKKSLGKVESEIVEQIDSVLDELMIQESSDSAEDSTEDEDTASSLSHEKSGAESTASRGRRRPRRRPLSRVSIPSLYTNPLVCYQLPDNRVAHDIPDSDTEEMALRDKLFPQDRKVSPERLCFSPEEDAIRSLSSRVLNQIKDNVRQSSSNSGRSFSSRSGLSGTRGRGKLSRGDGAGVLDADGHSSCADTDLGRSRSKRKYAREDASSAGGQRLLGATKRRLQNAELARLPSPSSEDEGSSARIPAEGPFTFSSQVKSPRCKK